MTPAQVIKAPPGLGKTSRFLNKLATKSGTTSEIYVPTHALAVECKKILNAANPRLSVRTIAGRSHPGANGKPLCKKHKTAEAIVRAGGEVYSSLCSRPKANGVEQCRYYASCPYIQQFAAAAVTIYTHAHLPLIRSNLDGPVPDIAIIDEAFFQSCIERLNVPASLLRSALLGSLGTQVCHEIETALQQRSPVLRHLRSVGIDYAELVKVRGELARGGKTISPRMSQSQQCSGLQNLAERTKLDKMFDALTQEIGRHRSESHALTIDAQTQTISVHLKRHILRFQDPLRKGVSNALRKQARVIIIDACADERLAGEFFAIHKVKSIHASRRAKVVQCRTTRCSTTSLVRERNTDPASKQDAKRRLGEVETFIGQLASRHAKVLVVGPQVVTGNSSAKPKVKPLLRVPANVDLAHFNAIRGIDRWKDHDAVVIVGRNEPPIKEVEAIARCVYLSSRDPLHFADRWITQPRGYRILRRRSGVDVICHPDPRIQAVLEQQREHESVQAIDRIRLVHAATPKEAYILSNIPLDIDVDQLVSWEEMMHGSRVEQAWGTLSGVMPLAPAWLAARFSALWGTADAAKADVGRFLKECQFSNRITIRNLTLLKRQYRVVAPGSPRPTARSWSVCLSRHTADARTQAALQELLGETLLGASVLIRP